MKLPARYNAEFNQVEDGLGHSVASHIWRPEIGKQIADALNNTDRLERELATMREQITWVLKACTIDRDAKHELEDLLNNE